MKIAVVADIHRMAPGGVTCGKRMGGRAVPLFPSGAPGVKYAYLNADAAVASMKRNGAVLAISGHQHEGVPLLRRDGLSFVCAPALCEPPFRFLVLEIAADGRIGAEEVSLQSAVSGA